MSAIVNFYRISTTKIDKLDQISLQKCENEFLI